MVDLNAETVYLNPYSQDQIDAANEEYATLEEKIRNGLRAEVVLASVKEVEQLRKAFPNFYADTSFFLREIIGFLATTV